MDNILNNLPDKYVKNYNLVEINNKLTFGNININNLNIKGHYYNHLHLNNLHGRKINISPIKSTGLFNVFQINNYNVDFTFKVNHLHQKTDNNLTSKIFKKVKKLERVMENYQTGLHIKCYQNLTLEHFEVNSLVDGEQIIYFKDCIINQNLILNLTGRSMVILDNTSIHGIIKFNMKTKAKPLYLKPIKKAQPIIKSSSSIKKIIKPSKKSNIILFIGIIIAIIIIIFIVSKKKKSIPNYSTYENIEN
jgi:hypothetical protein